MDRSVVVMGKNMSNKSNTNKIWELDFVGSDYCKVNEFIIKSRSEDIYSSHTINNTKKGKYKSKDENAKAFCHNLLLNCLCTIQEEIHNNQNGNSSNNFFIGCSDAREELILNEGKAPISIFMNIKNDRVYYENPSVDSRLNGIVGAVSLTYDSSQFGQFKYDQMKISDNFSAIRINIHIYSRFDRLEENDKISSYFVATMLTHGNISKLSNSSVYCTDDNLFDFLLIDILGKKLEKASLKGLYRTYRQFTGNDDRLRGSIDIARHIRLNAGQKNGRVAYKYRENTINNYLNILIVKVYKYIKKRFPEVVERKIDSNRHLRDIIAQLSYSVDDESISEHTAIMKNLQPVTHPYYNEYDEVRKVCLKLLRNEGVSIFDADKGEVSGFLYYMPDLWEDYLEHVFKKALCRNKERDIEVESQKKQRFITKGDDAEKFLCISRPDFVFSENEKNVLILDAKMKPRLEDFKDDKGDIQKNFAGDIDKCIRDMEVFGTQGTGLVFPVEIKNIKDVEEYIGEEYKKAYEKNVAVRNIGANSKRKFYVSSFFVPNSSEFSSYKEWKKIFDLSEKEYVNQMSDLLIEAFKEPSPK